MAYREEGKDFDVWWKNEPRLYFGSYIGGLDWNTRSYWKLNLETLYAIEKAVKKAIKESDFYKNLRGNCTVIEVRTSKDNKEIFDRKEYEGKEFVLQITVEYTCYCNDYGTPEMQDELNDVRVIFPYKSETEE